MCACATPIYQSPNSARGTHPESVEAVKAAIGVHNAATVKITRERTALRGGLVAYLTLDGNPLAELGPGEQVRFPLLPGEYLFAVRGIRYLGARDAKSTSEIRVRLEARLTYELLIYATLDNGLQIMVAGR
jgi:hypothetical protein